MSNFILVLAPEVDSLEESWLFKPFGDHPLSWIIKEARTRASEGINWFGFTQSLDSFSPFPYFFAGNHPSCLNQDAKDRLINNTHIALVDCSVFHYDNFEMGALHNANIIGAFCSGKETAQKYAFLIQNQYVDSYRDIIISKNQVINSDIELIALICKGMQDPPPSYLMNKFPGGS